MKLYTIEIHCGLDYEGDGFEILGIFDSKEKAEIAKIEYENSEEYQRELKQWDYFDINIVEYKINTLTREID